MEDWQSDVSRFIGARLDEDEAAAKATTALGWRVGDSFLGDVVFASDVPVGGDSPHIASCMRPEGGYRKGSIPDAEHIARWDPARVLAEIAVKREITRAHDGEHYCMPAPDGSNYWNHDAGWAEGENHPQTCPIHRMYAALYKDHPDYRQEWAP